ncbi:MAG: HlyD family efflux transporter periplasmic adaptor subunit [Calditrichaeota bacterium]|nr:HlyD family efflux transporter periplasmic adaptor subunit [Calditrichota bacterium]MCB9368831.1 HlyD family efflux transporter periplasmic adaptor subunit [Calditrichota bacterium]
MLAVAWLAFSGCSEAQDGEYQGYVEGDYVDVASSQAGRLDSVAVTRGDTVAEGAALYYLEATIESEGLKQAQEQLATAQAQLSDMQQGRRPAEINVIKAQLEQAIANRKSIQSRLSREEKIYGEGSLSPEGMDELRAQADMAEAKVTEMENQLKVASLPARTDQLKAQEGIAASAEAAVLQAKWKLDQKAVHATDGGLVVDVLYQVGEWIPAGYPAVRLLPEENRKIRFFVPESQLSMVKTGQEVVVHADGWTSGVPATVSFVSTTAEYTPPIIYSNETRSKLVYMIEARPVDMAAHLNVGQPVTVRFK